MAMTTPTPSLARSRLLRDFRRLGHQAQVRGHAGVATRCAQTLDHLLATPDAQLPSLVTAYAILRHELRVQLEADVTIGGI